MSQSLQAPFGHPHRNVRYRNLRLINGDWPLPSYQLTSSTWAICWGIQAAIVLLLCVWMLIDPRLSGIDTDVELGLSLSCATFFQMLIKLDTLRFVAMIAVFAVATLSGVFWCSLSLFGRRCDRSIVSLLAFTSIIAAWLACLGNWHDISWYGKCLRSSSYVATMEPVCHKLQQQWPIQNGDHELLGPFLAYPTHNPMSLILMSCPETQTGTPSFNGVERTANGGIGFPLIGTDGGDWLEWHPPHRAPTSYRTGLQQDLQLRRAAELHDGWFLVRYQRDRQH